MGAAFSRVWRPRRQCPVSKEFGPGYATARGRCPCPLVNEHRLRGRRALSVDTQSAWNRGNIKRPVDQLAFAHHASNLIFNFAISLRQFGRDHVNTGRNFKIAARPSISHALADPKFVEHALARFCSQLNSLQLRLGANNIRLRHKVRRGLYCSWPPWPLRGNPRPTDDNNSFYCKIRLTLLPPGSGGVSLVT